MWIPHCPLLGGTSFASMWKLPALIVLLLLLSSVQNSKNTIVPKFQILHPSHPKPIWFKGFASGTSLHLMTIFSMKDSLSKADSSMSLVDRPTRLSYILDFYLSTYNYKWYCLSTLKDRLGTRKNVHTFVSFVSKSQPWFLPILFHTVLTAA